MCGIAGVVALDGGEIEPGLAGRMRDRILHRGPDGSGEYEAPGVSLAACRLAIVDLDPRGRMPMATPDGRYHIVHNGEIYNRLELRHELGQRGVVLRTTTDTEVLLHLWALDGRQMLDRLDGMFAFAIWDAQQRELFAARDRAGEKPFFCAVVGGRLLFASEPKALFAGGVPCAFDEATWAELLTFRSVAGTRTAYRGVQRLLPGHWLRAGQGSVHTGRWWAWPSDGPAVDAATFSQLLEQAVRRRLVADVPVGTLLSGGLDSSSVTTLAAEQSPLRLPAFTVRYPGSAIDEGPFAAMVAAASGVEHHQVALPDDELPSLLADAAWYYDEPMAFQGCAEVLAVARYARQHVRVLLTGESADELFGGYTRMRLYRYPRLVRVVAPLFAPFRHRLRPGSRWQRLGSASARQAADWVAFSNADAHPDAFTSAPLAEWAPYRAEVAAGAVATSREPVHAALIYERLVHLPSVLVAGDRMTMGAGIEARLPFTDPRLLAVAGAALPGDLFAGAQGKQPLRRAMAGRLPSEILTRPKQGWTSPFQDQLRRVPELRRWLSSVPEHDIVARSPFGMPGARRLIDGFLSGDERRSRRAWMLGRIVLWHQVCVEGQREPFESGAAGRSSLAIGAPEPPAAPP